MCMAPQRAWWRRGSPRAGKPRGLHAGCGSSQRRRAEAGSMEGQLAACVVLDFVVAASDKEKETEEINFTDIF